MSVATAMRQELMMQKQFEDLRKKKIARIQEVRTAFSKRCYPFTRKLVDNWIG